MHAYNIHPQVLHNFFNIQPTQVNLLLFDIKSMQEQAEANGDGMRVLEEMVWVTE